MRKARVVAEKGSAGVYHCTTRVVEKAHKFGEREKNKFLELLRDYAEFCGVQVLTFCIMSNHVHVHVRVPLPPEQLPDDAELVRLAGVAKVSYGAKRLERELAQLRKEGDLEGLEKVRNKFLRRMWNVSKYMQAVKQRFTQWFNILHGREGTLWEGRFRSVLVQEAERAVAAIAAYVDLNPVRAGMVEDPGDYAWTGYGEAIRGSVDALEGLRRVVMTSLDWPKAGETEAEEMERVLARYRVYLFEKGEAQSLFAGEADGGRAGTGGGVEKRCGLGIDPTRVEEVIRGGGKLSVFEAVRCRNRYFTEGVVLGTEEFVEKMFEKYRGQFGVRRRKGARELSGVDLPGLAVIATLRKQVLSSSGRKE
jgi:putative transposase